MIAYHENMQYLKHKQEQENKAHTVPTDVHFKNCKLDSFNISFRVWVRIKISVGTRQQGITYVYNSLSSTNLLCTVLVYWDLWKWTEREKSANLIYQTGIVIAQSWYEICINK